MTEVRAPYDVTSFLSGSAISASHSEHRSPRGITIGYASHSFSSCRPADGVYDAGDVQG
jgi:hypothetical protein